MNDKVRIGNDIRLKVQLKYKEDDQDVFAQILSAEAFFINTTLKKKLEDEYKKKNRFIGRFPIEPFVNEFEPSAYNINSGGFPRYRAFVANSYNGFGYHPNWKECAPIKDMDITTYRSQIERTSDPSVVIVTFPASAQLYEGEYELVIRGKVYDPGYSRNERTVTADLKQLFTLVSSQEEAIDNPVEIDINNIDETESLQDVYVVAGQYSNNSIKLSRNDLGSINIDVTPISGWYEGD